MRAATCKPRVPDYPCRSRASKESRLPGLASYARVRDYRAHLLRQKDNVEIYLDSKLNEVTILEFGFQHVFLATGSRWCRDGTGRYHHQPITGLDTIPVFTPDDLMVEEMPQGHVMIFDDDHYYMGGVLAEKLIEEGNSVTLVTPAVKVSAWTEFTLEQERIQTRLLNQGVNIICSHAVTSVLQDGLELSCIYSGRKRLIEADALVLVTARNANDTLYQKLKNSPDKLQGAEIKTLEVIGDAYSPGSLASAIYFGHLAARCFEGEGWDAALFNGERPGLIR